MRIFWIRVAQAEQVMPVRDKVRLCCSTVKPALRIVKSADVIGARPLADEGASGVVQPCRGQVNIAAAAEHTLPVINIPGSYPLHTIAADRTAVIIQQPENTQSKRLLTFYRPAGIVQGCGIQRESVTALQRSAAVIQPVT